MDSSNLSWSGVAGVAVGVVFMVVVRMLYPRLSGDEATEGRSMCSACGWLGPPNEQVARCGQCGAEIVRA